MNVALIIFKFYNSYIVNTLTVRTVGISGAFKEKALSAALLVTVKLPFR